MLLRSGKYINPTNTNHIQSSPKLKGATIPVCRSTSSRLNPRPDFINEALPGLPLFLLPYGIPCPQAQETQHVHFVDFLHPPAVLHQFVVGGIDVFRQGQASCGIVTSGFSASARICSASCTTGIVGKVSSTSVVCVWVAISASAMSCISRSAG